MVVLAYRDPNVYCRWDRNDKSRLVEPFGCVFDDSVLSSACRSVVIRCVRCLVTRRGFSGVVHSLAASKPPHYRPVFRRWYGVAIILHTVDGDRLLGLLPRRSLQLL